MGQKNPHILVAGPVTNPHMLRFLTNLKKKLPEIKIDLFYFGRAKNIECKNLCDNIYVPFRLISLLCGFLNKVFHLGKTAYFNYWIRTLFIKKKYDIINFHFVPINSSWAIKVLKRKCKTLVFTPWGSDVLRQNENTIEHLKKLYAYADYVTASKNGFRTKVQNILNVSEDKFYDVGFGSDMIDLIAANESLTRNEAKKKLNFDNKFIITVGYNANPAHHHLEIIEQINQVRDKLPENLLIVLPMSYPLIPKTIQHIANVKALLTKYSLNYYCVENYISNEELLLLRKCSDVFIHAQTTDAASASLTEYLLTDNIVLNASWLLYPQLEQYGMPYYKFDTLDELGDVMVHAINNPTESKPSKDLKTYIRTLGWDSCSSKWAEFFIKEGNRE